MRWLLFVLAALVSGAPTSWAQEGPSEREKAFGSDDEDEVPPAFRDAPDEGESEPPREAIPDDAVDSNEGEPLPTIGQEDQLAVFALQRGLYLSSDVGVFFTFGGANGSSNAQPYVAVHAGFDLNDFLGVQASLSGAYVDNNPPSDTEFAPGGQQVSSYQMFSVGAELVGSFRPLPQLAIEPKLGGGIAHITPSLTDPDDPGLTLSDTNGQLTYGADVKYLTLLTGFTAGASFTGTYVFGPDIPGLAIGLHVRYTL